LSAGGGLAAGQLSLWGLDRGACAKDICNFLAPDSRETGLIYKKYMCVVCGWIYDEELGAPDEEIPPGTLWGDVPANWQCPDCGAGRDDFDMVEN
jgi:rubredoxin